MPVVPPAAHASRPPGSRMLHWVDRATSSASAALLVCLLAVFGLVALAAAGFPRSWTNFFWSMCATTSVVMAFVIQHTQSRLQSATQLKLDELIRSAPSADDGLVRVETGEDSELQAHEQRLTDHRRQARRSA